MHEVVQLFKTYLYTDILDVIVAYEGIDDRSDHYKLFV